MRFLTIQEFIQKSIPALIAQTPNLTAIFSTYNQVAGYEDGEVKTGKINLEVTVATGNMSPCIFPELASREGKTAQFEVNGKLTAILEQPPQKMLAVVYAGISAFKEALTTVRAIHRKVPDAYIILLTCDCELEDKKRVLQPHVDSNLIKHVVVTPVCGGESAMGGILDALIKAWPGT
jgi:hypothetical protein